MPMSEQVEYRSSAREPVILSGRELVVVALRVAGASAPEIANIVAIQLPSPYANCGVTLRTSDDGRRLESTRP